MPRCFLLPAMIALAALLPSIAMVMDLAPIIRAGEKAATAATRTKASNARNIFPNKRRLCMQRGKKRERRRGREMRKAVKFLLDHGNKCFGEIVSSFLGVGALHSCAITKLKCAKRVRSAPFNIPLDSWNEESEAVQRQNIFYH